MSNTTPHPQSDYAKRLEYLKEERPHQRARFIKEGRMNPEGQMQLSQAVSLKGICLDMCPEYERVRRIVEDDLKLPEYTAESLALNDRKKRVPDESRMVKAYQRSAAGMDVELVSDIRSPSVCLKTMKYMAERLDQENFEFLHGWLWDRTRAVRKDLTTQAIVKEDIPTYLECLEQNARLLLLSLHHMANCHKEDYSHRQDLEQLNATMISLKERYNDNRNMQIVSRNEVELQAYRLVLFLSAGYKYTEHEINRLPESMRQNPRLRTALKLYQAAQTVQNRPRRLSEAKQNWRAFWEIVRSPAVSYLMACAAEVAFRRIRGIVMDTLYRVYRQGNTKKSIPMEDWTVSELIDVLGLDTEDEVLDYCGMYGFEFGTNSNGQRFLDINSVPYMGQSLEIPDEVKEQTFSWRCVESKRHDRLLSAVIKGMSVMEARNKGLILDSPLTGPTEDVHDYAADAEDSLFIPDETAKPVDSNITNGSTLFPSKPAEPASNLNPFANAFQPPNANAGSTPGQANANPFASATLAAGSDFKSPFASTSSSSVFNPGGTTSGAPTSFGKPSGFGNPTTPSTPSAFTTSPATGQKIQPGLFDASKGTIKFSPTPNGSPFANGATAAAPAKEAETTTAPTPWSFNNSTTGPGKPKDMALSTSFFSGLSTSGVGTASTIPKPIFPFTSSPGVPSMPGSPFASSPTPSSTLAQTPTLTKRVSFAQDDQQQKEKEAQERRLREERERRAHEEQARTARLEQERRAQEERERIARQEQERRVREEQQRAAELARLEEQRKREKEEAMNALTENVFLDPVEGLLLQYVEQQVKFMTPEIMMEIQKEKALKRAEEMYQQKKRETLYSAMQLWTSKLEKKRRAERARNRRKWLRENKEQLLAAQAEGDANLEIKAKFASQPNGFKKPVVPASMARAQKRSKNAPINGARVAKSYNTTPKKTKISKPIDLASIASNGVPSPQRDLTVYTTSVDATLDPPYKRSTAPVDRTETDWFRLRALGIDPSTVRKRNYDSASEDDEEPEMSDRKRVRTTTTPSIGRPSPRTSQPPSRASDDIMARFRAFKESRNRITAASVPRLVRESPIIEKARAILSRDATPQNSPPNVVHEFSRSVPDLTSAPHGPGRYGSPPPANKPAYWARKSRFVPQHLYGKGGDAVLDYLHQSRGSNTSSTSIEAAPLDLSSPMPTQQSYVVDTQDRLDLDAEDENGDISNGEDAESDVEDEDEDMEDGIEYESGVEGEGEGEGEYELEYEEEGYEQGYEYEDDEDDELENGLAYKLQYSHQQNAQFVSQDKGPGATQDDAIELSD
ncbi:hypothetical protein K491DRAFT_51078 [Lophiostoma macrostomum CBS 122681]|uniref:SAC3/GANP/THP3 conserved domain-containing protein n=1 Tax=Lophiostoma macrostomum CBS 122681 TaxID=1314788 RepID=A0A6A6T0D6_9PLEO|nr:hypothetical protein K491DRAFT_51078 [Lophiostoma macrostomum CBS 122681]